MSGIVLPDEYVETSKAITDALDGWTGRAEIAKAMGKAQLSGAEIFILELMAVNGVLERRELPYRGRIGVKIEYRKVTV